MMKALLAVITITYAAEHPCIPPELCPKGQLEHCVANLSLGDCVVGVCAERKTVPKGHITVLDYNSGNIDIRDCPDGRYEPTVYHSDAKCGCQLIKSKCSGEGQIISTYGSTSDDNTCLCDYTQGYIYSQSPNDICKCRPRLENCNCEIKKCDTGKFLSPDYSCVNVTELKRNIFQCKGRKMIQSNNANSIIIPVDDTVMNETCNYDGTTEAWIKWKINYVVPILTFVLGIVLTPIMKKCKAILPSACVCKPYTQVPVSTDDENNHVTKQKGEMKAKATQTDENFPINNGTKEANMNTLKSGRNTTNKPVLFLRVQENDEEPGSFSEKYYDIEDNKGLKRDTVLPLPPRGKKDKAEDICKS